MRKKNVTRSRTSNKKSCQVFLSHAHKDKRLAMHIDKLISERFGQHVSVYNTSKIPLPAIYPPPKPKKYKVKVVADEAPEPDSCDVIADAPISTSRVPMISPGVYVEDDLPGGEPGPESKDLIKVIEQSCVIIVLLTEHSAESDWVQWEAMDDVFEPARGIPVYGGYLLKNPREILPKFFDARGARGVVKPTKNSPKKEGDTWYHRIESGNDIIFEAV